MVKRSSTQKMYTASEVTDRSYINIVRILNKLFNILYLDLSCDQPSIYMYVPDRLLIFTGGQRYREKKDSSFLGYKIKPRN